MVATLEDVHVDTLSSAASVVRFTGEHDLATCSTISEPFESVLAAAR